MEETFLVFSCFGKITANIVCSTIIVFCYNIKYWIIFYVNTKSLDEVLSKLKFSHYSASFQLIHKSQYDLIFSTYLLTTMLA